MSIRIVAILLSIFLLACDQKSPRNQKLQEDIDWETKNTVIVQDNITSLNLELEQIFARSLKYRFPSVEVITRGRIPLKLKDVPYLKAIEFKFLTTEKLEITFVYQSQEKIAPHFSLFLFSPEGINIFRYDVDKRNSFFGSIKPGKEQEEIEKVTLSTTKMVCFFLVQEIK